MNTVIVPYSTNLIFEPHGTLKIETYRWVASDYQPAVHVCLCHNGAKIKVKIYIFEKEPTCRYSTDDSPVWRDSCAEMFVKPYEDDDRYLNIEVNAAGAMIFGLGDSRIDRISLVGDYKKHLQLQTDRSDASWTVQFELPFECIQTIFSKEHVLKPGDAVRANFYKCGDDTPRPHFGMWNDIPVNLPDFHIPQYFGELLLEK